MTGRFRGVNALTVVTSKSVKEILDISDGQDAKLKAIAEKSREESAKSREGMRQRFSGMQGLSQEERMAAFQKLRTEADGRAEALREQVVEVLNDAQQKKLTKIWAQVLVQTRGPSALVEKPVVDYVEISPEQVKRIRALLDESRRQIGELYRGGGREGSNADREARRAQADEARKKTNAKARDILNEKQQATVKGLIFAKRIELDL